MLPPSGSTLPSAPPPAAAIVAVCLALCAGVVAGGATVTSAASGPAAERAPVTDGGTVVVPLADGAAARVHLPSGPGPHPVILYVHGGGWVGGDAGEIPAEFGLGEVTDAGWALVSVAYRLADAETGVTAGDQVDDVEAALAWLGTHGATYGLGPRLVAVGHSAGAHLVSTAAARTEPAATADAVVTIAGIFDFAPDVVAAPLVAPTLPVAFGCAPAACDGSRGALEPATFADPGDPPVTIVHGTADGIASPASSQRYAESLRAAGVGVDLHLVPDGRHAGDTLGAVVRALLAEVTAGSGHVRAQ